MESTEHTTTIIDESHGDVRYDDLANVVDESEVLIEPKLPVNFAAPYFCEPVLDGSHHAHPYLEESQSIYAKEAAEEAAKKTASEEVIMASLIVDPLPVQPDADVYTFISDEVSIKPEITDDLSGASLSAEIDF